MDNFREEIIVRRTGRVLHNILYILSIVFMIASAFIAFIALMPVLGGNFDIFNIIILVVAAVITILMWRNKDTLRTEYEYTLTNGEMDFAKVMGNSRRKHLLTIQLKTVEQGGLVESDAYRRISSGPNIKKTDLTINMDVDLYYLYYSRDGVRNIILLEPSDEMVRMMKLYNRNFA